MSHFLRKLLSLSLLFILACCFSNCGKEESENPDEIEVPQEPEEPEPEPEPVLTPEEAFLSLNAQFYKHIVTQEEWDAMTEYDDPDKYKVNEFEGWTETIVSRTTHKEYHIYEILDYEYTTMKFVDYTNTFPNHNTYGSIFLIDSKYESGDIPLKTASGSEAIEGYYRITEGFFKSDSYFKMSVRDDSPYFNFFAYDSGKTSLYHFKSGIDCWGTADEIHPIHIYRIYKYKYERVYILGSYKVNLL